MIYTQSPKTQNIWWHSPTCINTGLMAVCISANDTEVKIPVILRKLIFPSSPQSKYEGVQDNRMNLTNYWWGEIIMLNQCIPNTHMLWCFSYISCMFSKVSILWNFIFIVKEVQLIRTWLIWASGYIKPIHYISNQTPMRSSVSRIKFHSLHRPPRVCRILWLVQQSNKPFWMVDSLS